MNDPQRDIFLKAYDSYADAIYRYCYFRVFSRGRAEELMQEAFMKAWQYISDGNEVENMRAFLYKVATNLIIDDSRKKKEESLDIMMEISDAAEPSYDGSKEIEASAMLREVIALMDRELDEEESRLLKLRYIEDLDPKEIAEILGITANNTSVKLNRAVAKLKKHFT